MKKNQLATAQPGPFTRYLVAIDANGKADESQAKDMLRGLCDSLRRVLNRRCLWNLPTIYLGIPGPGTWLSQQRGSIENPSGELLELAQELFSYLLSGKRSPLSALHRTLRKRQLEHGSLANVDGNLLLYIDNFIVKKQSEIDPLGYRIYSLFSGDLEKLAKEAHLQIEDASGKIRNSTVLKFPGGLKQHDSAESLDAFCANWAQELMPSFILARGRARVGLRDALYRCLLALPEHGIESCTFGELLVPFKNHIRQHMRALYSDALELEGPSDGEFFELKQKYFSAEGLEDRENFIELANCISRRLHQLAPSRRKEQLLALWLFLRDFAVDPQSGGKLVASRLAQELEIPRNAIPSLRQTLGDFAQRCGARSGADRNFATSEAMSARKEKPMTDLSRLAELNARAAKVIADNKKDEQKISAPTEFRPGWVIHPGNGHAFDVDWLIVTRTAANPARLLLFPIDSGGLMGSNDVQVLDERSEPVGVARCQFPLWLSSERLLESTPSVKISAESLVAVKTCWLQADQETDIVGLMGQEIDVSPDYREWIADVVQPAYEQLDTEPSPEYQDPTSPTLLDSPFSSGNVYKAIGLAAMIVLLLGGLWGIARSLNLATSLEQLDHRLTKAKEQAMLREQRHTAAMAKLRQELSDLATGQFPVKPIIAWMEGFRGDSEIVVSADATHVVIGVPVPPDSPHSVFRLSLTEIGSDEVIWFLGSLTADTNGHLWAGFPKGVVINGKYLFKLEAMVNKKYSEVDRTEIAIQLLAE